MPTYEYRCEKCGDFEYFQKISDPKLTACPSCDGPVTKLLSAAPFHLKGSGWYKTDYANGKTTNGNASNGSSQESLKPEVSSSNGTDSKANDTASVASKSANNASTSSTTSQ